VPIIHQLAMLAAAALPGGEEAALELAPQWQRLAELRAIMDKPGLVAALDEVPVERIEYVRTDLYRVTAGRCHLDVRIVGLPVPEGVVGARRFEVRLGTKTCGGRPG
jgi:hypothetical protein